MLTLILIFALLLFSFYKTEERLFSLAERLAVSHLQNTISRECNLRINEILKNNNIDLSSVLSSNSLENDTIQTDYSHLNLLKTEVADSITHVMHELSYVDCNIPSGALISKGMFAGYGFSIPVRLIASGTAYVDFSDEFISSGINQTKYRLCLKITVNIELQTVFNESKNTFVTEIPITEKIIIGDVPNLMLKRE